MKTINILKLRLYGKLKTRQKRLYYNKNIKRPMTYELKESRDWYNYIKLCIIEKLGKDINNNYPYDTPIIVYVNFYLQRPKSRPKKYIYPDKKPDLDNLEKILYDAMQGIIYTNDSRIIEKHVKKEYGQEGLNIEVYTIQYL